MKRSYIHERVRSAVSLRRRGRPKIRSIKTKSGHVVRIAFPKGRRRRGAGRVQAVLHPKNPQPKNIYRVDGSQTFATKAAALRFAKRTGGRTLETLIRKSGGGYESTKTPIKNPPVKIYDRICEIIAVKGPGHRCNTACKRAGHTYRHRFTTKNAVYGMPDGSLVIR